LKDKYRSLIIGTIVIFLAMNAIPTSVLGKTRQYYLTSFIYQNEIQGEGFTNAIGSDDSISFEATAYALDILNYFAVNPHNIETLKSTLEDNIEDMFNNYEENLYDLFFLMKSLNILDQDYKINLDLENKIYKFLNDTEQITGGFSYSNTTNLISLTSTYYSIQLFSLIEKPIENITIHKNWVLSCYNSDGGYGSNQSLPSTMVDTCFAVFILEELGEIEALNSVIKTIGYLQSFYVIDSADLENYGGYVPDDYAQIALLSSTYYCVKAVSLIDSTKLFKNTIKTWVLARQNFMDGGFAENTEGYQQKTSSIIASYYAFETLKILGSSSSFLSEIWMVEFNYWILGIVLFSIGLVIVAAISLWRRTRI